MALPGGYASPFKFQSEAQAADRKAREDARKREEEAARRKQEIQFNRQALEDQIHEKYVAPVQKREAERASLGQMVSQFSRQQEEDKQKNIALERGKLNEMLAPHVRDVLIPSAAQIGRAH